MMKMLGHHEDIVSFVGAYTLREPLMLVMEYMPYGNLQYFLMQVTIVLCLFTVYPSAFECKGYWFDHYHQMGGM